jgi:UDP-glucose 4-epimerase
VRILDNLSTGKYVNLIPVSRVIDLVIGDIRDKATVAACMKRIDAVVHLAAVASVQASIDNPVATHQTNFNGTLNLLESARQMGVKRFLYASSAAIYGNTEVSPVTEELTPNPLTPYAIDKLTGEHYLHYYFRQYGLATTAFRFFNIYGPRQDPSSPYSGVISIFMNCLHQAKPVTLFGDGRQTRDFVYVDDLADLLANALYQPSLHGQVVNVGTGREQSLLQLIDKLELLSGKPLARKRAGERAGDIARSCADTRRLQRLNGTVPATPLEEGLEKLMKSTALPIRRREISLAT